MRRDVRLLGSLLGGVLSEAGGQELLDDVEQLRHAVIESRRADAAQLDGERPEPGSSPDDIAALVASWPLDRAEQVASAFTVYFHLANLAEEHQRIRALRERDVTGHPLPESLDATVREIRRSQGGDRLEELLAGLRVHPVFTAHPTEARRRAVVASLRRISVLMDALDDPRLAATDRTETLRELREQIDVLWRTSQLRVNAMDPIDEVRSVMAAFDETLFRVVPALYRSMDHAVAGSDSGSVPTEVPAFLRFGSWVGADRDGNPFVTARVTREAATIQADHVLRAFERATSRIGRSLTLYEATTPASPGLRRALDVAAAAHPELLARDLGPLSAGAVPHLPAVHRGAAGGDPQSPRRPGLLRPGRIHRRPAPGPGIAGGRRCPSAGVRRGPAPHLAGGDVRLPPGRAGDPPAQRGARPGTRRGAGRARR